MRTALITGGARGIGRAIALDLAEKGWNVAICYRTSEAEAEKTAADIECRGGRALSVRADVSDRNQVEALFARVEETFGAADVLVHGAGPYHRIALLDESAEGWRSMFANNLDSFFYCARRAAPAMIEKKWGRMIAFSMANVERAVGQTHVTAYYIAKLGVLNLVRSLARSLAEHNITVNAISPGFIDSGGVPALELQPMVKNIPAGYLGTVTDAVCAASYLLSDGARYVNGSNIILSGAWGI